MELIKAHELIEEYGPGICLKCGNPFCRLVTCKVCGKEDCINNSYVCDECEEVICEDCLQKIGGECTGSVCEAVSCEMCVNECSVCGHSICPTCLEQYDGKCYDCWSDNANDNDEEE